MEDVLEVYHRPFDAVRPLVCLDEATKQLLGEMRPPLPMQPSQSERVDGEYTRHDTTAIFLVCEPLAGQRHVFVRAQRKRQDFAAVIKTLCDKLHSAAQKIVLVLEVAAWQHARNAAVTRIDWRFTTANARIKLKRLYPAVLP